ncbi:hypothetical protein EJ03DRAFT_267349 [Teratosphaeria nubilosa]|uniref:valine--tRNA ligase n=1 Tax=Teratosphaeria nubilosa TaxID=161662 RepID=A0A6G1LHR4_9PEZI|nr:hypothetical protein EJ03DRAFT_267349 [Teratosphaeria nubilosa]
MALNAASHNITGTKTGPVSDPKGHNAPGQDGGDAAAPQKQKSEKELAKEKAKAEKLANQLDDDYHKAYIPSVVESAWYDWWEKEGFHEPEFEPDGNVKDKGYFVISIPPPNVTGNLHIGHALATSLQDAMIRWNRMKGKTVLYVPGCDHAGISTQSVVENMLYNRENGKTRHDLGRAKFVERVWEWKEDYHQRINRVMKRMGGSMDWTKEGFTMSPTLSKAVRQTFVQLHDEGLIYRENKLVNWCCKLSTTLSNIEVDDEELNGTTKLDVPGYDKKIEFGSMWNFKYQIDGSDETIEIGTTRPETMLGDTGIAVHPSDERYKRLLGKKARHPFIEGRMLPIIGADDIEMDKGTGAVKITPAHDQKDFKRGKDAGLEFINILNDDGTLNANAGKMFEGQKRYDARHTVLAELEKLGLYVGKTPNPMKVPRCSKSKDIIEPVMKPQWWVKMAPLAKPAVDAVRDGKIKIIPEQREREYYHWMETPIDWCISRQLWWGHQIPAWYVRMKDGPAYDSDPDYWICAEDETAAQAKAAKKFAGREFTLERDPDCLDTWFSSGLWPFSTLGWPDEQSPLYQKLFPTSVLETGWDILFFWVARMIFFSLKLTGKVPFEEVYCHSLVRDGEGRKMSKSLGNVIDPVDIMDGISIDDMVAKLKTGNLSPKEVERAEANQRKQFKDGIDECGADALRYSLINYTTGGGDINFDVKVMRANRNFCNKIYQATKFVLGNLPEDYTPPAKSGKTGKESLPERWILHKLTQAAQKVNAAWQARQFSEATQSLYQYWLYELCDVYIENSKAIIRDGTSEEQQSARDTLYTALDGGLRLMHPVMPFLTEELWQRLPRRPGDKTKSVVVAEYPEYDSSLDDPKSEAEYDLVLGCSKGARSLLVEYGIKENGTAFVQPLNNDAHATSSAQQTAIKALSGKYLNTLHILKTNEAPPKDVAVYPVSASAAVYLELPKDGVDANKEINKVQGKLETAAKGVKEQEGLIAGLAPDVRKEVKQRAEDVLRDRLAEQKAYEDALARFEQMKL